jgi:hypothetical protein
MKTRMFIMIMATVFAMINLNGQAQEKFGLSYKMEKGKTYKFTQDNKSETTQEMGGQEMKMSSDGHTILKYEVENISTGGNISLIYSYDEVKFHMKGMGRDTIMDMTNLMDKRTRAVITKTGKVLKETPLDTSKSSKSNISLSIFASANMPWLPEKEVGIGDKWPKLSNDTTPSQEGQTVYKRNVEYTLTGKDKKGNHDCLKIEFKGTVEMTGKMKQMGMDLVIEGSGDISGTAWFDPALGMLIEEQTVTAIEMNMAVTGQAQMTVPMSQKISTTQKLVE